MKTGRGITPRPVLIVTDEGYQILSLSQIFEKKMLSRLPLDYLQHSNSLHKNLQFTLETQNFSGDLALLDLNINVNEDRKIDCHCYQKSTDTGIIPIVCGCAALQHNKNLIQETVHRIFNVTNDWQSFDVALKKHQEIWTENQ